MNQPDDNNRTAFFNALCRIPNSQELEDWSTSFGKFACTACAITKTPCQEFTLPIVRISCKGCWQLGTLCSREYHQRRFQVKNQLGIDDVIFDAYLKLYRPNITAIPRLDAVYNPPFARAPAPAPPPTPQALSIRQDPQTGNPRDLMVATMTTIPTQTIHSQAPPQIHVQVHPIQQPQPQSALPSSSSPTSSEPAGKSSISQIFHSLSSISVELDSAQRENEDLRTKLLQEQAKTSSLLASIQQLTESGKTIMEKAKEKDEALVKLQAQFEQQKAEVEKFISGMQAAGQRMIAELETERKNGAALKEENLKLREDNVTLTKQVEHDMKRKLELERQLHGDDGMVRRLSEREGELKQQLQKMNEGAANRLNQTEAELKERLVKSEETVRSLSQRETELKEKLQASEGAVQRFNETEIQTKGQLQKMKERETQLIELIRLVNERDATMKRQVSQKDEEMQDQLRRANILTSSRSKDYTDLNTLIRMFARDRRNFADDKVDKTKFLEKCDKFGIFLTAVAGKIHGDLLKSLCVEEGGEAESTERPLKRTRVEE